MTIEANDLPVDSGSAGATPDYIAEFLDDDGSSTDDLLGPESPDPVTPEPAAAAPETPQVASPQQPTSAPVQAPAPAQQAQPEPAPAAPTPQPSQEELNAQYLQSLETAYAVSADDATAMLTAPETVLPRFATNLHVNVMREVSAHMQRMMQAIPAMLEQHANGIRVEQEARQSFENAWPGLKGHYDTAVANAKMIRQANPNATREQMIEMTGMMTALSQGLDPQAVRAAQQQVPRPAPTAQQQPLRRPVNIGSGPAALPSGEMNPFTQLANEFDLGD